MKVNLKRQVKLDGHVYRIGIQEIPDEVAGHWFFLALVSNGEALVMEAPKKASKAAAVEVKAEPKEELPFVEQTLEEQPKAKEEEEIPRGSKKKKRG